MPGICIITGRPRMVQICGYLALAVFFLLWRVYRENREKRQKVIEHPIHKEVRDGLIKRRILLVVVFYALGIVMLHRIPAPNPTVTVLDVGQGDCTVVISPHGSACLIDGGSSSVSRVGEKRILPFLEYEGIREVEMIFLTHGDQDHINGIPEVLESREIEVHHIAVSRCLEESEDWDSLKRIAEENGISWHMWARGDRMDWGEIRFTCLYPFSDTIPATDNDGSLMLLMETGNFRGLLTGDVEEAGELAVLSRGIKPVHWLKVAHHGSRYSTCEALLKQIKPLYATISYGEGNRYGHPHKETLDRLEAYGSFVLSTPDWGAITIECGAKLRVTGFDRRHGP